MSQQGGSTALDHLSMRRDRNGTWLTV